MLTYRQPMLETKTIIYGLYWLFGLPATFIGVLLNYGTWKADILFFLSAILVLLKIAVFAVDRYQRQQERRLDLERKRHELKKYLRDP